MKFSTNNISYYNGTLMLQVPISSVEEVLSLMKYCESGKRITVEVKRERRSNDANALAWAMCRDIAEKLAAEQAGFTAVDVYRKAVMECGHFTVLPIKEVALDSFKRIWRSKGIGWLVEDLGASKLAGYVNVAAYHGSSTYDSKEMSRLIDNLVQEAQAVGVQIRPPHEIERLVENWK